MHCSQPLLDAHCPHAGDFRYLSYRDPNLLSTLDAYDGSPAFLKGLDLSADELTKVRREGTYL